MHLIKHYSKYIYKYKLQSKISERNQRLLREGSSLV